MSPRIVFMGTPEFAVASLDKLFNEGFNIVGVVTAPDRPAGRGLQIQESAIKQYAQQHGLQVLQPVKLKDPDFLNALQSLRADLQIVVAFRMLPEVVWNMPPMGTLNLHGSLLPQYRGAAPINWAIINGESTTGVTTFKLKHEIDTGNILQQEAIPIGPEENAGELHDVMKEAGALLLVKTVKGLIEGSIAEKPQPAIPQDILTLKHAPKIHTETCEIKWDAGVDHVYNLIRGLSPYPGAFTMLHGKKFKIYKADKEMSESVPDAAGQVSSDGRTFLKFSSSDGYISVKDVQLEGKKRMPVLEFLRGFKLNPK